MRSSRPAVNAIVVSRCDRADHAFPLPARTGSLQLLPARRQGRSRHAVRATARRRAGLRHRAGRHRRHRACGRNTQPVGLRAGRFVLHPVLEEAVGYDSAPFGATGNGSWMLDTRPSLGIASDWSRDALGAYVAMNNRRYLSAPTQRPHRTHPVARRHAGYRPRPADAVRRAPAAAPGPHADRRARHRPAGGVPAERRARLLRRQRWSVDTHARACGSPSWRFSNATLLGAPLDQSYRDRTVIEGGVTLDDQLAPRRDMLLVIRGLGQHYLARAARPAHARFHRRTRRWSASPTTMAASGATDCWSGLKSRQFAASAYPAHTEPIGEAAVTWNPSGMTTLTATLTRSMEDAAQEGVSGFTYTAAKLSDRTTSGAAMCCCMPPPACSAPTSCKAAATRPAIADRAPGLPGW